MMIAILVALAAPSQLDAVVDFGSNPGALAMYEHIPTNAPSPMPLVLVLHGCTQDRNYADDAGFVGLADRTGAALVVAEQSSANNQNECFNWFQTEDITRGSGEALSLAQMIDAMKSRHSIDDARVFVTGLSAGGAMTAVMLATYPDVFAAGAIFAGVPYGCAHDVGSAFTCMYTDQNKSQEDWATLVDTASSSSSSSSKPRVAIWAGTGDTTVMPVNADELVSQWTGVHALSMTPTATTTWSTSDGDASVSDYGANGAGLPLVESVRIPSMTHGTPIDPSHACGTAAPYVLDVGLCGAARAFAFFGLLAGDVVVGAGEGEGANGGGGEGEGDASGGTGDGEGANDGEGEGLARVGGDPASSTSKPTCATGCASAGSVSGAWPLVIALALIRRRRRTTRALHEYAPHDRSLRAPAPSSPRRSLDRREAPPSCCGRRSTR